MTYKVYKLLKNGIISGDEIGKKINMSRAGVNKHIKKLRESGIEITSLKGVGYQIKDTNSLNYYQLKYIIDKNLDIIVKTTESTNNDARAYTLQNSSDLLVTAPIQTKGKGRLKREFISAEGGAYFTLVKNETRLPLANIMRVVLIVGLAVSDTLNEYGISNKLKWPNDIMVNDKKICGILLELISNGMSAEKIIMGIGINVNNEINPAILDIATSMQNILNKEININEIIKSVVDKIYIYIEDLVNGKWAEIKAKYIENSYTLNKIVTSNGITGKAIKLTDEGFLVIQTENEEKTILTGDVNIIKGGDNG